MRDARRNAAERLAAAIDGYNAGQHSLSAFLQICLDACLQANLEDEAVWFRRELGGYADEDPLPQYRQAMVGNRSIQPLDQRLANPGSPVRYLSDRMETTHPDLDRPPQRIEEQFWGGVDLAEAYARDGHTYQYGDWITVRGPMMGEQHYRPVATFHPLVFQQIVVQIRATGLEKARRIATALTFGDAVEDIWQENRETAEAAIARIGFEDRLAAIRDGIQSPNVEQWRAAMYSCRSVLEGLSGYLWRDPSPVYPGIEHNNRPLDVAAGRTINRLVAYLHCNGVGRRSRQAIGAELELLNNVLHAHFGLDSKAHDHLPVSREDARYAVISTYSIISQFAIRTDLEPVENTGECGAGPEPEG
jgi:hypothetical protein